MNITSLSSSQLRKAADLKEQIAELETELSQLLGSPATTSAKPVKTAKKKRGMSAAGRAAVAAAQKARWAKIKGAKTKAVKPIKKKNKMSAAGRARIAAAQKARWAKIKVEKK